MIRVLVYFALILLAAFAATWLADRPGTVLLTWQGTQIETSLLVALVALAALVVVLMFLWSVMSWIMRGPESFSLFMQGRRRSLGMKAVSRGLVAVGVGDARRAAREAAEARRYLGAEPMALLLQAQSAQLSGDRTRAEAAFQGLLEQPETRALGLRGLFVEAERRGDHAQAREIAEEAARTSPEMSWALDALFAYQCGERDWSGALATVERLYAQRAIDRRTAERRRAVLLTAEAQEAADTDPARARELALQAHKLAPDLIPAATLAGKLLAEAGEARKAMRTVEATWRKQPHPDLAEIYLHAHSGESARDRLKRAQTLADRADDDPEGALTIANAAIDAREFGRARAAIEPLLRGAPTVRTCLLMARIEELEHGDAGRAREWLSRALRAPADPAWVADGLVSESWMPTSPITGRLDAFDWKVPPEPSAPALAPSAALAATERMIAAAIPAEPAPAPEPVAPPARAAEPAPPVEEAVTIAPAVVAPAEEPAPPPARPETAAPGTPAPIAGPVREKSRAAQAAPAAPMLVEDVAEPAAASGLPRPPDDPGPEGDGLVTEERRLKLIAPP